MKKSFGASLGLSVLLASLTSSAHAVVVYNWVNVDINPLVGEPTGWIAFDEDAWSFGGALDARSAPITQALYPTASLGIHSVYFGNQVPTSVGVSDPLGFSNQECQVRFTVAECESSSLLPTDMVMPYHAYFDVDLQFGEFLQGSMFLSDIYTDVTMSSQGPLWTISSLGSDGGACGISIDRDLCVGSTGYWRLDHSTVPVDAPQTAALLLAGLVGITALRRRNRTST